MTHASKHTHPLFFLCKHFDGGVFHHFDTRQHTMTHVRYATVLFPSINLCRCSGKAAIYRCIEAAWIRNSCNYCILIYLFCLYAAFVVLSVIRFCNVSAWCNNIFFVHFVAAKTIYKCNTDILSPLKLITCEHVNSFLFTHLANMEHKHLFCAFGHLMNVIFMLLLALFGSPTTSEACTSYSSVCTQNMQANM